MTTEIVSVTQGGHGTVTTDGSTVSYSPEPDYCGSDNFTYTLNEAISSTNTAAVDISIECANDAPIVCLITAPIEPIQANTLLEVSGVFNDVDGSDTHTAIWDWGDDTSSEGTVDGISVSGSHIYTNPGVFTIGLIVTDKQGGSDTLEYQYVVVYDPDGGFVTGGGWFISPAGAYYPDPSLSGKATFGFVSKYKKGADIPTGETEFQFRIADLNFHSDSYDWLVIAGKKAQFKGVGTINGEGNFGFMLTAIDAKLTPSTDVDSFRIKIWDKANDTVVCDNQMGADEIGDPTTVIGGGSIVVHK